MGCVHTGSIPSIDTKMDKNPRRDQHVCSLADTYSLQDTCFHWELWNLLSSGLCLCCSLQGSSGVKTASYLHSASSINIRRDSCR